MYCLICFDNYMPPCSQCPHQDVGHFHRPRKSQESIFSKASFDFDERKVERDKYSVPLTRGTRSFRFTALYKRGASFSDRAPPGSPSLPCSYTHRTWPVGPSSNYKLWTQSRKGTQDPPPCWVPAARLPPDIPSTPLLILAFPAEITTIPQPLHTHCAPPLPMGFRTAAAACLSFPEPLPPCSSHTTSGSGRAGQPQPLKVRLDCISPRLATWSRIDTQLLSRPLLSLVEQVGAGWNLTEGGKGKKNLNG